MTGLVYDQLISYPEDSLEPQPELATGWDVSEDGTSIKISLRDDVKFHDGREMTSDDVRFSLETYSDPTYAGQLARVAQLITDFDTSDPHTITLRLSKPVNNLFDLFEIVPIIDRNTFAEWKTGESYNGTGAFEFVDWHPGSRIEFTSNENYWDGNPTVDGVELLVIPDQQTQFSQLRSGQLDVLLDSAPRDVEAVRNNRAFNVINMAGSEGMVYLGANVAAPDLENKSVRQAISLAVDRERIVEEVYQTGARATNLPWPEYSPAYTDSSNSPARDIEKARELIAEAGEIPPITLNYSSATLEHKTAAEIVADNLAEIGIEVVLEPTEYTTMIGHLRDGSFDGLWLLGHGFSQYNPSTLITSAFPFNSEKNSSNFSNEEYAQGVEDAWFTNDPENPEALQAYGEINRMLLDESFVIELAQPNDEIITTGALEGIGWSKRAELDLSDAYFTR